jgi:hypothetical protein
VEARNPKELSMRFSGYLVVARRDKRWVLFFAVRVDICEGTVVGAVSKHIQAAKHRKKTIRGTA